MLLLEEAAQEGKLSKTMTVGQSPERFLVELQ